MFPREKLSLPTADGASGRQVVGACGWAYRCVCVYVHALLGVCVHGYVFCCGSFIGIPIGGVYV